MIPILSGKYDLIESLPIGIDPDCIDVVVPLCIADYDILRANPLFEGKALFPSASTVSLCHDKFAFREWFKKHFSAAYLPADDCSTPLVIAKPRQGEWGHNTYLVDASNQAVIAAVRSDPAMYLENYVPGQREYSMHILFAQGQLIYAALSTYDHAQANYVQGVTDQPIPTTIVECDEIPKIFHDLLTTLNYSGAANIDYKIDETGQIRIFELNPRIGGSIAYLTDSYIAAYVEYIQQRK